VDSIRLSQLFASGITQVWQLEQPTVQERVGLSCYALYKAR